MKKILAVYVYQQLNAVLVSLYLLQLLRIGELFILQIFYLGLLVLSLHTYHKKESIICTPAKRRFKWLCIGLVALILVSFILSIFHSSIPNNQANLIQAQKQVPAFSFLLFLVNASVVEEFFYRGLLWKFISKLDVRFALTTVLFALVHHPTSITFWCLYGFMGLVLALVRYKTDLIGSVGLHLIWNVLVFVILVQ
ncbi:CPBP family intramembrane metalloprotease [Streptococcus gordonii]|mgnify:CR=1 FL=1|uniref:CPBP family intramembrane glutamic endopeptidase n=1 Tax=Streptococcus gordonii TaxID=1302 RepID=UPI000E4F0193|nr:type II CAAX endopeptidase family protein [Streptococcus gordonii]RHE64470.1 CPBP family intramembrane metalloprotease [Streptococcus gordonii]